MKSLYQLLKCPLPEINQFNDFIIKDLSFYCPLLEFHPECPLLFIHQMPFKDRENYIKNLSNTDKQELIDEHQKCLTIEEKDIFGKIFLKP